MKKISSRKIRNNLIAYSFIAPNFIGYLIFTLIPVACTLLLSLCEWNAGDQFWFVGLKNYQRMIRNSTFRISLSNTLYYAVATVPATMVLSLLLAKLLNMPIRGRTLFRSALFFPHVAAVVAIAAVWNMLFQPEMGPVNMLLTSLGVANPPRWAASTDWAMPVVILASIWRNVGYYMIIYLAGLQGIPGELYEAARMDGASGWQSFRRITIPMLTPITFFVSIMLTISCFKVFDIIYTMTEGGPGRATNVLVMHIYQSAFTEYKFGYASAVAMVLFVMVLVITLIQFRMEKKWTGYM